MNFSYSGSDDFFCLLVCNVLVPFQDVLSCPGMDQLAGSQPSDDSLGERGQQFAFLRFGYPLSIQCAAVLLKSNYIMCGIDKPPGEIAALRRPQGSISQTFAGTVSRDEVFQGAKPFTEARFDRKVYNST